jgi:hypothetical protein
MDSQPPTRRLPTSVLVAAVLVALVSGGTWWFGAQPPSPAPVSASAASPSAEDESSMSSVLVLQMGDGTIVVDDTGTTTLYRGMRQPDSRIRPILGGGLACRIGGRGPNADDLGARYLAEALASRSRGASVPRCGRPSR